MLIRMILIGAGIVFNVAQIFTSLGFNIDELATDTVPAGSQSSPPWFLLEAFATAPDDKRKKDLDSAIKRLADELDVKCDLTWTR